MRVRGSESRNVEADLQLTWELAQIRSRSAVFPPIITCKRNLRARTGNLMDVTGERDRINGPNRVGYVANNREWGDGRGSVGRGDEYLLIWLSLMSGNR